MKARKFSLALTLTALILLSISGSYLLFYINTVAEEDSIDTPNNDPISQTLSRLAPMKEPVNLLLLVSDRTSTNTDTIMVINYNPVTAAISLLSIPRDTKVNLNLRIPKINSLYYLGGPELLVDQINSLFRINIKYYMYVDISAFKKMIDVLGGVDFDVPARLKYDDAAQNLHIDLQKGMQHLDGNHAEQLLRFRHPNTYRNNRELRQIYDGSDLARINVQQDFMKEIIRQKANVNYFSKLKDLLKVAFDNINETNVNTTEALRLSQNISKINPSNFNTFKVMGIDDNSSISYYVYKGKILNNTTKEVLDGDSVIDTYFHSKYSFDPSTVVNKKHIKISSSYNIKRNTGSTPKKNVKKSVTKNNPSNSDSSFKGKIKVEP